MKGSFLRNIYSWKKTPISKRTIKALAVISEKFIYKVNFQAILFGFTDNLNQPTAQWGMHISDIVWWFQIFHSSKNVFSFAGILNFDSFILEFWSSKFLYLTKNRYSVCVSGPVPKMHSPVPKRHKICDHVCTLNIKNWFGILSHVAL